MSYLLSATEIKRPQSMQEHNETQVAQNQALNGTIRRDYFGNNKRKWRLTYKNVGKTDYDTIKTIYNAYLNTASAVAWQVTETNYTIAATTVHVDLQDRGFSVGGADYLSDFDLILTEA